MRIPGRFVFLSATLALGIAAVPRGAPALTMTAVPQPPGVGCVAVKIASITPVSWGAMNCSNGMAYLIKNKVIVIPLAPPPGATSEKAWDVDGRGHAVGAALVGAVNVPMLWKPNGAPLPPPLPNPGNATAAGIEEHFLPIVGFADPGGLTQAFWYLPGPHFIPPAPAVSSFAYDVSVKNVAVGQLNGVAAATFGPNIAPLPGFAPGSTSYAINISNLIVGHMDVAGAGCLGGPAGVGFRFQYPGGPLLAPPFGPLAGDCTATAEDDNDRGAVVGYSAGGTPLPQAIGMQLPAPFPPGLVNLNAIAPPHVWLTDAPGIDNLGDVIVTDGGAAPTHVYVLN
jgi:hypothetical protein